jgi:hypothetical protein
MRTHSTVIGFQSSMSVKSHMLSRGIVMDVVVASADEFGVDGGREARFALEGAADQGL